MKESISDNARIEHIIECIEEIEMALRDKNMDSFINDHVLRIAVVKWLEIIGEAANNISKELKDRYKNVEWQKIIGLRHVVVYEYFGINYNTIWITASQYLNDLKREIDTIKFELNNNFLTN